MRDELGERFCITLWSDNCLAVFSEQEWERICEKIRQLPLAQASKIQHYIFPNACIVEPDKQGRVLIPQNLRDSAGLDKDVAVIGVMDRAEIWDIGEWERSQQQLTNDDVKSLMDRIGF